MTVVGPSVRAHKWFIIVIVVTAALLLMMSLAAAGAAELSSRTLLGSSSGMDSDGDGHPDRPTQVAAAVAARTLNEPVEVRSMRTADVRTFANVDGTLTDQIRPLHDTWVRSGTTKIQGWSTRLLFGRVGGDANRMPATAYIRFPQSSLDAIATKTITKATLNIWQYDAGSCSARPVNLLPLDTGFNENTTTFSNRPVTIPGTTDGSVLTANKGRNNCPGTHGGNNGFVAGDVTKMTTAWARGEYPNWGLQMSVPQ